MKAEPAFPTSLTSPVEAPPPTALEFRRAMGAFATGVTVVTGTDGEEAVGFACQSFTSVSLEPPLVLFCVDSGGRSWPRMRASGRFCVNVLGEQQDELCGRFGSSKGKKYEGLEWDRSQWGTPSLRGVLLRVHADVYSVHAAGDHDVVIGRVLEVESAAEERPMVFFRGRFGIDGDDRAGTPTSGLDWGWGDRWG